MHSNTISIHFVNYIQSLGTSHRKRQSQQNNKNTKANIINNVINIINIVNSQPPTLNTKYSSLMGMAHFISTQISAPHPSIQSSPHKFIAISYQILITVIDSPIMSNSSCHILVEC